MDNTYTELCPVGAPDTNGMLAKLCQDIVVQGEKARSSYLADHDAAGNLYLYGDENGYDADASVFNKTQGMVNAFVGLALRQNPVVSLEAACVGDEPLYYSLGGMGQVPATDGMGTPLAGPDGQPAMMPQQLPEGRVDAQAAQQIDAAAPGSVLIINNELVTEFYQEIFDIQWERARTTQFLRENVWLTQLYGFSYALYNWDEQTKEHDMLNIPNQQWYPDPMKRDVRKFNSLVLDWPIDQNEAKRLWPNASAAIDEFAAKTITRGTGAGASSTVYTNVTPAAPMVTMRTTWLRNQQAPMTENEGLQSGLLQEGMVSDEMAMAAMAGQAGEEAGGAENAEPIGDATGVGGVGGVEPQDHRGLPPSEHTDTGDEGQPAVSGDDAESSSAPSQPPPTPMRRALFHAQAGIEVTPDHPQWPRKSCIRRVLQVANQPQIVDDAVEPHWDIPVIQNINVPIPHRPFGQGEPMRVRSQQRDLNSMHSSAIHHAKWFRSPTIIMDASIADSMDESFKDGFMEPGKIHKADLSSLQPGQEPYHIIEAPELPEVVLTVKAEISDSFDQSSGYVDALQGISAPAASGKQVQLKENQATTAPAFKFMQLEEVVWRIARLQLHSLIWFMEPQDLYRISRKYPIQALPLIIQYAREGMEWDTKIDIGQAQDKAQKDQRTITLLETVDPVTQEPVIDVETARDRLGEDNKTIQRRIFSQRANAAVALAQQQPGAPTQQKGGGQNEQPAGNPAA